MLRHSDKDRHNNESNKIVIKPDKILALTEVTVYQRDAVKKQLRKLAYGLRGFSI